MTSNVVKLHKAMTKQELISHLRAAHSQAVATSTRSITKADLVDLHRLIHLGLGR